MAYQNTSNRVLFANDNRSSYEQRPPLDGQRVPYGYTLEQNEIPRSIVIPAQHPLQELPPYNPPQYVQYVPPPPPPPPPPPRHQQPLSNSYYVEEPIHDIDKVHELLGSKPQDKKEKLINWCGYILPILFLATALFIAANLHYIHHAHLKDEHKSQGMFKFLINNLRQTPISDVTSISSTRRLLTVGDHIKHFDHHNAPATCPAQYSLGVLGVWRGVKSGCLCADGTVHSRAYCLIHRACKQVSEVHPANLQIWKAQKLCVKPVQKWKWSGTAACDTTVYNQCSPGICVGKTETCPLSSLTVATAAQTTNILVIDTTRWVKNFNTNQQPVIQFSTTSGATNSPCYDEDVAPSFESKKYFPLANDPQKGCTQQITSYTTTLSNQLSSAVYTQNSLTSALNDVPFFNSYQVATDTYNLQTIQRIAIAANKDCDDIDPNNFQAVQDKSNQLYTLDEMISLIVIIISVIGLVSALFLYMMRGKEFQQTKAIAVFAILAAILFVIFGAVYLHHINGDNGLIHLHKRFKSYITTKCFIADPPIHQAITDVDNFSSDVYTRTGPWVNAGFGLGIAFLIILLIVSLLQHFSYKQPIFQDPWKTK